jgi:nucleoside-diphosphate-sugar epimerase
MVLPPIEKTCFTKDFKKGTKILVTGAGGFIGSHLAKRLKEEGHWVRAVDWKENEYMTEDMFCNEFINLDLRFPDASSRRARAWSGASTSPPTWAAWASSSPTTRASSTTRR